MKIGITGWAICFLALIAWTGLAVEDSGKENHQITEW